ncbi:MAG: hypothetical protein V9E91_09020 [Burkholderiaceae bacterium]
MACRHNISQSSGCHNLHWQSSQSSQSTGSKFETLHMTNFVGVGGISVQLANEIDLKNQISR